MQSRQHYSTLSSLQSCKQIPKDDKLFLRKMILSGNLQIIDLLATKDPKRMQVKLRKLVLNQKAKRAQNHQQHILISRENLTYHVVQNYKNIKSVAYQQSDCKKDFFKKNYREHCPRIPNNSSISLRKSLNVNCNRGPREKLRQKSLDSSFGTKKQLTRNRISTSLIKKSYWDDGQILSSDIKNSKDHKRVNSSNWNNNHNNNDSGKGQISLNQEWEEQKFNFSKTHFLEEIPACNSAISSNIDTNLAVSYLAEQNVLNPESIFTSPQLMMECRLFLSKVGLQPFSQNTVSLQSSPGSQYRQTEQVTDQNFLKPFEHDNPENKVRSLLIGKYSEDLFDSIVNQNVKSNAQSPGSLFMGYPDFIRALDRFFSEKCGGSILESSSDKEHQSSFISFGSLPSFPPFQSAYETVTFDKLIEFMRNYCLTKINPIREFYLQLGPNSEGVICVEDFNRKNEWRGEDTITAFRKLVNQWGKWGERIGYWEMYWAKDSEELINFKEIYNSSGCQNN